MKRRISWVLALCLVLLALTGCDSSDYKKAQELFEAGEYEAAEQLFDQLGDYEDSKDMVEKCKYSAACELKETGDYEDVAAAFEKLGDYEDAPALKLECEYQIAEGMKRIPTF